MINNHEYDDTMQMLVGKQKGKMLHKIQRKAPKNDQFYCESVDNFGSVEDHTVAAERRHSSGM